MKQTIDFLKTLVLALILDALIFVVGASVYMVHLSEEGVKIKVEEMYREISAQTGQSQDALPLVIVDSPIDNAYNDGKKVVLYTGFINKHHWDEIALVIGHEIAHGMLGHLNEHDPVPDKDSIFEMGTNGFSSVLEANADKMGAVYMMKAGYDICKGREIYKTWQKEKGNFIGMTHPNYSYRYDELNINCD